MAFEWPDNLKDILSSEARFALDNWLADTKKRQIDLLDIIAAFPRELGLEVGDNGEVMIWTKTLAVFE